MPVSFRLLPTLTFLLLLPGVPVWALTASDTTRPAQAQDPLPDMGIAPQVDDDARHFAEVAKKFGEASMSDNGLTAGEQAQLFAISKIGNEVSHQLESWLSPWGNANVDLLVDKEGKFTGSKGSWKPTSSRCRSSTTPPRKWRSRWMSKTGKKANAT